MTSRRQTWGFVKLVPLLCFWYCTLEACALDTYVAAIYEHNVVLSEDIEVPVSPEEAFMLMEKNLAILEGAIKEAARRGAHIIVTPEDGIYGWVFTRETIYPYLEDIPDPLVDWIPCADPGRFAPSPMLERLSCLARNNSIYVVANMGYRKPCNSSDPRCPSDGHYQCNTSVVFDSEGKLVVHYHKYNLFVTEKQFNYPKDPEFVISIHPLATSAFSLARKYSIMTQLWSWQADFRLEALWCYVFAGSGIYAPDDPKAYYCNAETDNGRILVTELSSHPCLSPDYPGAVNWKLYASRIKQLPSNRHYFNAVVYHDLFSFTELTESEGNHAICQQDLCCHLSYKMVEKKQDEIYILGAFDGLHAVKGEYYLQICTLLKCKSTDLDTCGQPVETAQTKFEMFSLSGTFGTNYVFPEVLYSGVQLAPGEFEVLSDGRLISQTTTSKPVLSVTLFGRWYVKDPPHTASFTMISLQIL